MTYASTAGASGLPERKRYLLLNKPRGFVSTRSDPERRPTVIDLLKGVREYVYPVGRLDYDSEGLLLLTNDGDLAARLTHPRHGVERVYEARVRGEPDARSIQRLARGIVIEGRRTAPARARMVHGVIELTLREGRKRQVRLMCEAIGHPVLRLTRVRFGPIADDRLKPGQFRELTPAEVARLKRACRIALRQCLMPNGLRLLLVRPFRRRTAAPTLPARPRPVRWAPRTRAPRPCPRPSAGR